MRRSRSQSEDLYADHTGHSSKCLRESNRSRLLGLSNRRHAESQELLHRAQTPLLTALIDVVYRCTLRKDTHFACPTQISLPYLKCLFATSPESVCTPIWWLRTACTASTRPVLGQTCHSGGPKGNCTSGRQLRLPCQKASSSPGLSIRSFVPRVESKLAPFIMNSLSITGGLAPTAFKRSLHTARASS